MHPLALFVGISVAVLSAPAQAYIGPGVGAGAMAVVAGIIASVLLAFVAILWYPVKRFFKRAKKERKSAADGQA